MTTETTTPTPTANVSSSLPSSSTSTNIWIYISYGTIALLWTLSHYMIIPYVVHLLVLVTAILYAACHMSLQLREEPHPEAVDEDGNKIEKEVRETMKTHDAMQFPFIGSASLFSLYLAFKYLDKDWINFLIGFYFALVGCFAITMTIVPAVDAVIDMNRTAKVNQPSSSSSTDNNNNNNNKHQIMKPLEAFGFDYKYEHKLPEFILGPSPLEISVHISVSELIALPAAIGICVLYYKWNRIWYLNNILGICFCLQGIERFSLGTYKIGAILLVGLFFYDIFWVFGTDVMVTVAKNLDGPIKILFPRARTADGKLELSLLGLGDIVIPGFFLSLLLRFDAHNAKVGIHYVNVHEKFPKPYFHSALFAYFLGLAVTLFVMIQFQAAQPALLYLVPACLGSSLLCAVVRGELKQLFDYSEEEEEVEEEEVDGEKKEGTEETKKAEPKPVKAKKED